MLRKKMNKFGNIVYEQDYDKKVEKVGYRIPEALFGLMFDFVKPKEKVLDIGTGTGRAAKLFSKAGLETYGMDMSQKMLEICKSKGFFKTLKRHNLTQASYPFEDQEMDHIISVGVLNHFTDLSVFFSESARILRNKGFLGFMTGFREENKSHKIDFTIEHECNHSHQKLYCNTDSEIKEYLLNNSLRLKSWLVTRVCSSMKPDLIIPVKVYVAEKY